MTIGQWNTQHHMCTEDGRITITEACIYENSQLVVRESSQSDTSFSYQTNILILEGWLIFFLVERVPANLGLNLQESNLTSASMNAIDSSNAMVW